MVQAGHRADDGVTCQPDGGQSGGSSGDVNVCTAMYYGYTVTADAQRQSQLVKFAGAT